MDRTVTANAERPAGQLGHCFYCGQHIGSQHKTGCVLIKKRVKVRLSFNMEVDVPFHWDSEDIRFHYIDSSWCCDNLADALAAYIERGPRDGCLCSGFHDFEVEHLEHLEHLEDIEELGEGD